MGVANRAFVLRANVDTAELVGSASAPTAVPTDGTYWFDLASSSYGLFEWSQTNQSFTTITPTLITSTSDLVGGVSTGAPKTSIGVIGDYAINTTHVTNKIYKKTASNTWVQVGSTDWHASLPVVSIASGTTVTSGNTMFINGTSISAGGTALSDVNTAIGSNVTNVTSAINSTTGNLEIFHNGKALGDSTGGTNTIRFEEGNGTLVADLGLTSNKVLNGVQLLQDKHTNRPTWKTADENRPNGSVWFKTTSANSGAALVAKLYSTASGSFSTVASPLYATHNSAIYNLDAATGGTALSTGTVYAQYNVTEESMTAADAADATPNLADFQFFRYEGGATTITSNTTSPTFTSSDTFKIQESVKNQEALNSAVTVTLGGTGADDFIAAVNGAGLTNVSATKTTAGAIVMTHKLGGEFRMTEEGMTGTPLTDAGFSATTAHSYGTYTANSSTLIDNLYDLPTGEP